MERSEALEHLLLKIIMLPINNMCESESREDGVIVSELR